MERLVLIDGHAILHRAYHALPPLTNRSGELVNAVYGFCTILLKVIDDLKPQYLAVAFDTPKPTFRQDIFIGYQAQRPKMEAELAGQIEKVWEVLKGFKIPFFAVPGYEADDIIGTLARRATQDIKILRYKDIKKKKKKAPNILVSQYPSISEVIIVSGDKDLFQLVGKKVKLYMPIKGLSEAQLFGEKEVREKMGVEPGQIIDYKSLMGDPSDNYPGVPGVGPKTAVSLLGEFGTLEKVYCLLPKIKNPGLKDKLVKGRESAFLSQKLATVVTDVPLKIKWDKIRLRPLETKEGIEVLKKFGFRSLVVRLSGEEPTKKETEKPKSEKNAGQQKLF